jgi:hypothetical protein
MENAGEIARVGRRPRGTIPHMWTFLQSEAKNRRFVTSNHQSRLILNDHTRRLEQSHCRHLEPQHPCHLERSEWDSLASPLKESKGPVPLCASIRPREAFLPRTRADQVPTANSSPRAVRKKQNVEGAGVLARATRSFAEIPLLRPCARAHGY